LNVITCLMFAER